MAIYVLIVTITTIYNSKHTPKPSKLSQTLVKLNDNYNVRRELFDQLKLMQANVEVFSMHEFHNIKTMIDRLPIPLAVKTSSGKYVMANLTFLRFFNIDCEIEGKTDFDLFDSKFANDCSIKDKQLIDDLSTQRYIRVLHKDNRTLHILVAKSLYIFEQKLFIVLMITDLSDIINIENGELICKYVCRGGMCNE